MARKVWAISKWIWLTFIAMFLATFIANLLVVQVKDLSSTILVSVLRWFAHLGRIQILTLVIIGLFFILTAGSLIYIIIENVRNGGEPKRKYLRHVIAAHNKLNPVGIYQQSQALISVNVSLDANFIHMQAMPDRPRYDIPSEQERLYQETLQRLDLSIEEREEQIQRLRSIWCYSPQNPGISIFDRERELKIEEAIKRVKATSPAAIILGSPGSGKTTTLRWLAYHMASASNKWFYRLPEGLSHKQIPILIDIRDYAKKISTEDLSFEEFLIKYLGKIHPQLPSLILNKLKKGRCLLLLDGLDEVANDILRRKVAGNIYDFIASYSDEKSTKKRFNRFVITSRIVGYEEGPFNSYAHYTLLELTEEQIDGFLSTWCPAIERHMIQSAERSKELNALQKIQANVAGMEQKNLLLETIKSSPGIRRLAVNPLMLTILSLIQRNGKTLPHRRIDLYQIVTRTLLDNWNQGTGREALNIKLAEQTLSALAYHIHRSDRLSTERDVKNIVRHSMTKFYERDLTQADEDMVDNFIETIRRTSGVFVETGQGLFSFMHRTFQEYYTAQYILQKTSNDLLTFAVNYCCSPIWHEPLLLTIADMSGRDKGVASAIIEAIAEANEDYNNILHQNLLFAINSMVDCEIWSIRKELQKRLAYQLFDLYGDVLGAGRYTKLQDGIELASLLWLQAQPQESYTMPPLLEAWRDALCNDKNAVRQEGSVHLLASIGLNLSNSPESVLTALLPPLLKLADLQDLPCPQSIVAQFPQLVAHPSSQRVAEYAFVTLNLLDAAGPAGWLHTEWLEWSKECPELLERLTQHSLELGLLITPTTLPSEEYDKYWAQNFEINEALFEIYNHWIEIGQNDPSKLQKQLLQASNTVRYPHAYLLKHLLEKEKELSSTGQPWQMIWDKFLQEEMARGRNATYHACLYLQFVLCKNNEKRLLELASRLTTALSTKNQEQMQVLIMVVYFHHILDMADSRDLRKMRSSREFFYLPDLRCVLHLVHLLYLRYQRDIRESSRFGPVIRDEGWLNRDLIVENLCNILEQRKELATYALLGLFNVIFTSQSGMSIDKPKIRYYIRKFRRQSSPLTIEHRLLIRAVLRLMNGRYNIPTPSELEEPDIKAAIQILQEDKPVPHEVRDKAAQKIMDILNDEMLSLRPTQRYSDYHKPWRLDDILFEALQRLADQDLAERLAQE